MGNINSQDNSEHYARTEENLENSVRRIIDSRIDPKNYQLLLANRDNPNMTAYKELCESKMIRFSFEYYRSLGDDERKILKDELEISIKKVLNDSQLTDDVRKMIYPASDANVLDHEYQHIEALPTSVQQNSYIEVSILFTDGKYFIVGQAYHGNVKLEQKTQIDSLIAPKVLSFKDIELAEKLLLELDDVEYTSRVRQKINSKNQNII